jgi:NAD(P)-dependent dehydrogenase (short-subunit alcohol dehydrogenase family)
LGRSECSRPDRLGAKRRIRPVLAPLSQLGTADEIAKAVVFLASDDASSVTATEVLVDGGVA